MRSILNIFFLALLSLTTFLHASNDFDKDYAVTIERSFGSLWYAKGKWTANNFIALSNGLLGVYNTEWDTKSQAKEVSEKTYAGYVNVLPVPGKAEAFELVFKDDQEPINIELWLNREHQFGKLPYITSITLNEEKSKKSRSTYSYIIRLNDGSTWLTQKFTSSWDDPWEIGTRIIKIGNAQHVVFVNRDALFEAGTPIVKKQHYLAELEILN